MLHVSPHWNWPGRERQIIPVTVYTNCDAVELLLNGKSMGVKGYYSPRHGMQNRYGDYPPRALITRTTNDLHLQWDVPYEPGELKAVGWTNGKMTTDVVSTTGDAAAIQLSVDATPMTADRRDVAHVEVRIVDAQGRIVPTADNDVTFQISGPAGCCRSTTATRKATSRFKPIIARPSTADVLPSCSRPRRPGQ